MYDVLEDLLVFLLVVTFTFEIKNVESFTRYFTTILQADLFYEPASYNGMNFNLSACISFGGRKE